MRKNVKMGFHAVATGYLLKSHGDLHDYIHVVCKAIRKLETGEIYENWRMDELIDDEEIYDINEPGYEFIYHDDIVLNKKRIPVYSKNPKICVGETHCCAVMIFLSVVGDDLGGELKTYTFSDSDLVELMAWKNLLLEQGRIRENVKFVTVPNCCS